MSSGNENLLGPPPLELDEKPTPAGDFTLVDHQADGSHMFGTEYESPTLVRPITTVAAVSSVGGSDAPAREDHVHYYQLSATIWHSDQINDVTILDAAVFSDLPDLSVEVPEAEVGLYKIVLCLPLLGDGSTKVGVKLEQGLLGEIVSHVDFRSDGVVNLVGLYGNPTKRDLVFKIKIQGFAGVFYSPFSVLLVERIT